MWPKGVIMAEEKAIARKKIQAGDQMNRIMADYFYGLNEAATTGKQKVAWCTSVGPAELLRSLGFAVHFPENHAAMLGATRMSTDLIPEANAIGYSPDICSYLTADIGAYRKGITPLAKAYEGIASVPRPDVLVYNTNQCRDVQDWFAWYAKELGVPSIGITSPKNVDEVTDAHITDVTRQMEALVPKLEEISGGKLDMNRLRETVALSRECTELWKKVLETATAAPAPLTFFDGTIHMGPAVVLRGTPEAVDYYKVLLAELEQRISSGVGAVEKEAFRIYWDGMPVWGRLRQHSELFSALRANVVASTYCSSWIFPAFDENDPFRSMAKAYLELFIVRSDRYKETYIKEMLGKFRIDGIIYHDAKTCPYNSNSRYGLPQRLEADSDIPHLVITGDLNDLRCVSDEQTKTNIEAFIEQLEEGKQDA
jgi:benzoyl-CoA reductase/2-hydroxyglutaryl-CoA dehydratase subunit BcrC/BadD/HgdB